MSGDINVQTFSGKVNISNNLKVGSGHLFVDTLNNQVGLNTNDPQANLHVNGNTYVHTNFRVGSGIVMNDTTGRITAGAFHGDGTNITGINSDSGSWVNGTDVVHLATTGDKVGIGVNPPLYKLDVDGDINFTGALKYQGSDFVSTPWNIHTSPDALSYTAGNIGIGGAASATNTLKVTGTIEATTGFTGIQTSDVPELAAGKITSGTFHVDRIPSLSAYAALAGSTTQAFSVSTLTTTGNVGVTGDIGKNWGTGRFIMNYDDSYRQGIHFSTADRTMSLFSTTNDSGGAIAFKTRGGTGSSDTDYGTERMRIDKDGNVGIGTISPSAKLHVYDSGAASGWQNFYVRPTSLWGDGLTTASETAGTKYMTMNMVMIQAPHITPSSTGQDAYIRYGRAGGIQSGIWWETACVTDGSFRIRREANNSYGMTIDSSGNVGIGVTDPDNKLEVRGTIQASASDANHGMFLDHNGTIRRDYGFGGVGLHFTGDAIWPTDRYGTYANNQIDLGNTLRRWKTIWTTNALNSTSDDRLKHNEEEVVDALGTIKKLKLLKYDKTGEMLAPDYNGDLTGISHRKELGFIAQSVLEIPELSFLVTVPGDPEDELEHGVKRGVEPYGMEYQGINNLLVQAVQEVDRQLQAEKEKTQQLEVRLSLLESTLASLIS
jgi:hypothetical protein